MEIPVTDTWPLGRDDHGRRVRYRLLPRGGVEIIAIGNHDEVEKVSLDRNQLDLIAERVTAYEASR